MFTAKFIKNIFLDKECIKDIGRSGKLTRVFAKQGDLDGSCTIYSLMMMLIFHKFLDWEDLIDGERAKENEFVDNIIILLRLIARSKIFLITINRGSVEYTEPLFLHGYEKIFETIFVFSYIDSLISFFPLYIF